MGIDLWEVSHRKIENAPHVTPEAIDYLETWRTDQGTYTLHKDDLDEAGYPDNASDYLKSFIDFLKELCADGEYHDYAVF